MPGAAATHNSNSDFWLLLLPPAQSSSGRGRYFFQPSPPCQHLGWLPGSSYPSYATSHAIHHCNSALKSQGSSHAHDPYQHPWHSQGGLLPQTQSIIFNHNATNGDNWNANTVWPLQLFSLAHQHALAETPSSMKLLFIWSSQAVVDCSSPVH